MRSETDLSQEGWEAPDDPTERKGLLTIMVLCLVSGIVGPMLVLLYADRIDAFLNTLTGALVIFSMFAIIGLTWLFWRIRKMINP